MSLAIVHTRARLGIDAPLVTVEVHLSNGLPSLSIVGLPETAVKESKDRVRSALINSEFEFPARRITINLAPADLPKCGSRFDLAIAIGILAASGQVPLNKLEHVEFIGELALSGEVRGVDSVLPAVIACGKSKRALVISNDNAEEASLCEKTSVYHASNLLEVCAHLHEQSRLPKVVFAPQTTPKNITDFCEVRGQHIAKRALEIAAAGGHNILLSGPPGSGKTMLASRLPGIMPALSHEQSIDVASIYSLCGHQYKQWHLPPFRSPHHTTSAVALVGGGGFPKPGEISLAHNGVLFLDELPEFHRHVLEVLREPLESGEISISRAAAQLNFPARFQLVAAMNPCPCGYFGHYNNKCRCTPDQISRYKNKLSGPLLDRIDMYVDVPSLKQEELTISSESENSAAIRTRVEQARGLQKQRQGKSNHVLNIKEIEAHCQTDEQGLALLKTAIAKLNLSARAYHRILKLARTIADIAGETNIQAVHIAEAVQYRRSE